MTRAAARLGLLAVAAVTAAYLVQLPQRLPLGGPVAASALEGVHPREPGFRWTAGRATIRFPAAGGGAFRLEVDASAWRPRGHEPVPTSLSAGAGAVDRAALTAGPQTLAVAASGSGWWSGDVVATLESAAFRPPSDPRVLGVRVHAARLVPVGGPLALRAPPLRPLLGAVLATVLAFLALARLGVSVPTAWRAAAALALALGIGLAVARPWAATLCWPAALAAGALAALASLSPAAVRLAARVPLESARALGRGARVLAAWPTAGVVVLAVAAVVAAHRASPRVEVDLGSGREAAVASRFGPSDGEGGVSFRQPLRGAEVDLREFGGGGTWTIEVTAASGGPRALRVLARAAGQDLHAPLDARWATSVFHAAAPWGWRSGLQLTFPATPEPDGIRVDRVAVTRHGGLPSLKVVASVVAAALLVALAVAAAGLGAAAALAAAGAVAVGQAAALGTSAVAAIPFASTFVVICALGAALAAVLAAAGRLRPGEEGPLPAGVYAAAALAFAGWLTAAAYPLYRGGHFVFHSQIAEEIWRGRFLLFYLPFPGSILSRQEQWGNIIVPHPCLYHTLVSPLSALGRPAFHAAEKALLALALATMLVVSARLARRLAGDRAATWAAVVFATLVPAYQILGLGHLMMLCGVWAASLALAFVALRFEALPRPRVFLAATLLLTLCFLSYTASLLFSAVVIGLAAALLWRRRPAPARALVCAGLGAAALAFGLYYVNWAWPFLSQSLPRIAAGCSGGEGAALWSRLALQPGKLGYTYGTVLVPVLGLAGLLRTRGAPAGARVLLLSWAAVLVLVGGLDLFFNFLRKHHYFVMVPVAAGAGVLLARLAERPRWGRAAAVALCVASGALALRMAADVALGRIP